MEQKIKNLENYLNDLDNLIDTNWFPNDNVTEFTFHHEGFTLRDFVSKGREYIRQYLMSEKDMISNEKVTFCKCKHPNTIYLQFPIKCTICGNEYKRIKFEH